MKKLIVLLSFVGIGLFACSNNGSEDKKQNTENQDEASKVASIEHLTAATFKEKIYNYDVNKEWKFEGKTAVVIDFYADWCAPCKKMSPILEELNKEYGGKVTFYKINTEQERELAAGFGIQGIPAFLFIPLEGQPQMSTGYAEKADFEKMIFEMLKVKK
jgi:thioredoxin